MNPCHFHTIYLGISFCFIGQHPEFHMGKAQLNLGKKENINSHIKELEGLKYYMSKLKM